MVLNIQKVQKYGSEILKTVAEICERNHIRWYMAYGSALGTIRHSGPIPWDYDIDIYVPECDMPKFLSAMDRELPSKYWVDYRNGTKHDRSFPRIGLRGYETEILHVDVYRLGGLPRNLRKLKVFTRYSRILFVIWKSKTVDIKFYYPDRKRRFISRMVKGLTVLIPLKTVLKLIDKQANRIPFDEAEIVASPLTTMNPKRMHNRKVFDNSVLKKYEDFYVRVPGDYLKYLKVQFGNWKEYPPEEERSKEMNKEYIVRRIHEVR